MKSSLLLTLLALSPPMVNALPEEPSETKSKPSKETSKTEDAAGDVEAVDFINFVNDDTLHGKFLGFTTSGKIIWKNPAAEKNIAFTSEQVRKVVLNKGNLVKPFTHTSYLTLTNQDTIPGAIVGLDDKTVTLKTDYAGKLKISREYVSSIDFLPLGDKIHYRGPFSMDDWETFAYSFVSTTSTDKNTKSAWKLKNFALKNEGSSGVIMHKDAFEDKTRYTFKVTFRNSVIPSFILCADMQQPEIKKDNKAAGLQKANARVVSNRSAKITEIVGTSLIFGLSNYSSSLSYYGYDENGNSFTKIIPNSQQGARVRRALQDNILFDVRVDREAETIVLYANNVIIGQWDISAYANKLKGNKIGFANMYNSSSNSNGSMISDIVISSWNGVIDPATSMENADRDTLLLSNGTDRYSGNALKLVQNKLQLKGPYATLEIPTEQIQSLYFAKKHRRELPAKAESEVSLRFHGSGRLTGTLARGPEGKIILESAALGKLTIQPEFVSSYEFEDMDYAYEILK